MIHHDVMLMIRSPMHHGSDEKAGVDSLFRRQVILHEGRPVEVPMLTGNAIRGRWRRVAASRFCTMIGLPDGSLPPDLYHRLFSGGAVAAGSTSKLGIVDRRDLRRLIPYLSLFGCSWGADILQGKLLVGHAMPICRETVAYTGEESEQSVHELLDDYMQTRREDRESALLAKGDKEAGVQMLYRAEALVPGTRMKLRVSLADASDVEASCMADTVEAWHRDGATLGGRASSGYGVVAHAWSPALPGSSAYLASVREYRAEIVEFLRAQGAVIGSVDYFAVDDLNEAAP